ncbi:hypothetical protein NMY22_g9045 [Coprinellus aureogranulatus]|nr:hypothetical protein NMY22_g9045 [Coprinellus aureogranulatus]
MPNAQSHEGSSGSSFFSNTNGQSFRDVDARAAGRNMYNATVNVTFLPTLGPQCRPETISTPMASAGDPPTDLQTAQLAPRRTMTFLQLLMWPMLWFLHPRNTSTDGNWNLRAADASDEEAERSRMNSVGSSEEDTEQSSPESGWSDDFSVASLEDVHDSSLNWDDLDIPDVYIRIGERGIVPGDVGTFSKVDGFQKYYSLWDNRCWSNDENSRSPPETIIREDILKQYQAIARGASSKRYYGPDRRTVSAFEFRCQTDKGAVLVSTTSADLEQLREPQCLKDFLISNSEQMYQACGEDSESFIVVTGCIKTDGWAIASYLERASVPTDQIMRLERLSAGFDDGMPGSTDVYDWTEQAMAVARSFSRANSTAGFQHRYKDQTLFLRGFKMTFSQRFRERAKAAMRSSGSTLKDVLISESSSTGSSSKGVFRAVESSQILHRCNGESSSTNADGVQVEPLPGCSDCTEADCAMTHDDDWRHLDFTGREDDLSWIVDEIISISEVRVRDGVAFLERTHAASQYKPGTAVMLVARSTYRLLLIGVALIALGLSMMVFQGACAVLYSPVEAGSPSPKPVYKNNATEGWSGMKAPHAKNLIVPPAQLAVGMGAEIRMLHMGISSLQTRVTIDKPDSPLIQSRKGNVHPGQPDDDLEALFCILAELEHSRSMLDQLHEQMLTFVDQLERLGLVIKEPDAPGGFGPELWRRLDDASTIVDFSRRLRKLAGQLRTQLSRFWLNPLITNRVPSARERRALNSLVDGRSSSAESNIQSHPIGHSWAEHQFSPFSVWDTMDQLYMTRELLNSNLRRMRRELYLLSSRDRRAVNKVPQQDEFPPTTTTLKSTGISVVSTPAVE